MKSCKIIESEPIILQDVKLKVSKKTGRLLFQKSNLDRWLNG